MYGMLLKVRLLEPCSPQHLSSMQLPAPIRPSRVLQTTLHRNRLRAAVSGYDSTLQSVFCHPFWANGWQTDLSKPQDVRLSASERTTTPMDKKKKKKTWRARSPKSCVFFPGVSWKSKHRVSRTAPILRFPFSVWARVLFLTAAESVLMIELCFLVVEVKEQKLAQREEEEVEREGKEEEW